MVKGYDPTQTDPASIFLDSLSSFFTSGSVISLKDSEKYTKFWLMNSEYTSQIYASFRQLQMKPKVRLIKKCNLPKGGFHDRADVHFPTKSTEQSIVICLDKIRNKIELKEHLDRQMTFFYLRKKRADQKDQQERDQNLMHDLYQSCHSGYRNYMLEDKVTKELAINCSKYLFFRKSKSDLPVDRLFRYTSQMAQDLL